jgi:hypothetical protein
MGGERSTQGEIRTIILVGIPEGKRPLGRPRCKWEDNIKMELKEVGRECVDQIDVAQDRTGGGMS